MRRFILIPMVCLLSCFASLCPGDSSYVRAGFQADPYSHQVTQHKVALKSASVSDRATALETLGFLRAYRAADAIAQCLRDDSAEVRREAAMAIGWCGGRAHIPSLLKALADSDWTVRQAAWVSLTNITGMEFPFDALAESGDRKQQSEVWSSWWKTAGAQDVPEDIMKLLDHSAIAGGKPDAVSAVLAAERGMRALGAWGGPKAAAPLVHRLSPYVNKGAKLSGEKRMVQAGIRALGRLHDPSATQLLIHLLENSQWARYAADALGDTGDVSAALALLEIYPSYSVKAGGGKPKRVPPDDHPGFEAVDRMYETPFAIAAALSRLPLGGEDVHSKLREHAILFAANLPGDFDGAMLYEPEAHQEITAYLLECAGIRKSVCDIALRALGAEVPLAKTNVFSDAEQAILEGLVRREPGGTSFAGSWLAAFSRDDERLSDRMALLEHPNGWVRINAAKTFMFLNQSSASAVLARILKESKTEAEHGYNGAFLFNTKKQGQDEYQAPSPCWREAYTRALGALKYEKAVPLLLRLLNDDRNVLEVQYAAAVSLAGIGTDSALGALENAEKMHPFHSIRLYAREALWLQGRVRSANASARRPSIPIAKSVETQKEPAGMVFIKGANSMPNDFQIDIWRQTYSTTDSGPTYRLGTNLYLLKPMAPGGKVMPITRFRDGYVADCEVSWDGDRIVFARRGGDQDPWWHICEVKPDGSGLRQLTQGPYHDVQPTYLPDGRILFSSSRTGLRDEYHGYPATGLTVMNADGSDIHCIGFNLGRDNEPSIMHDGRVVFSRLDLFYSRMKTELTVQAAFPDGTGNLTLYGPERREFWKQITRDSKEKWWGESGARHRVLRVTQPQSLDRGKVLCASTGGAVVIGPGRGMERVLARHENRAITTPFPLGGNRALCAASIREFDRKRVDLGIYRMDLETGELDLLYNDPQAADYEARPLRARERPPVLASSLDRTSYTARLLCESALNSRERATRERGKYIRLIEGQPILARHHTHTSSAGEAWKNHVGTHARVLGTVPLAADGSFYVEIPADRLVHCQVLDSDRQVVGNQTVWMYARPGETRSCVGCHEKTEVAPQVSTRGFARSARMEAVKCLPSGGEFSYRAKAWQKGSLREEAEDRTRTVRAVNQIGRP